MSPFHIIERLLDLMEQNRQIINESYPALSPRDDGDVIQILQECETLTENQIRLLHRALRRIG